MTISAERLGIACWSIGNHAQKNIIPAILGHGAFQLIGSYTRKNAVLNSVAMATSSISYVSPVELLRDKNVKAVYISSPTGVHYEQIKSCITAGKSVLVEKTALAQLDEAEELASLASKNGLVLMEAFMYRFHPQFIKLREVLGSGQYGKIIRMSCEFGFPHLPETDIRYSKSLAGGALFDAGAYTLSAARNLLKGSLNTTWARLVEEGYDVDTKGAAALVSSKGELALCNWAFGGSYINRINIWLEGAHIVVDRAFSKPADFCSTIEIKNNGKILELISTGMCNHFEAMLSHYGDCISQRNCLEQNELVAQAKLLNAVMAKAENG